MTLEIFLIITIFVLLGIIFFLVAKNTNSKNYDSGSLKMIQDQILDMNRNIDFKLSQNSQNTLKQSEINTSISRDASSKIEEITRKLSSLEETNKKIHDIGKWLEWLESILKNPKQRWVLWEYFLENVLKNILPPNNFQLQYAFSDWVIVDAVIFVKEKIIPIDSKFSLENYNKIINEDDLIQKEIYIKAFKNDLKKRIDEASKYIKPEEWTMDFSFMFIPSEWIYYDLLVNKVGSIKSNTIDLIEYAFKQKKVIIVSPTSFYAYLQTVMQGLRALQIEEKTKDIRNQVSKLSSHLSAYEEYLEKLWNSLWVSVNHYNAAYKKFNLVEKDVIKITGETNNEKLTSIELDKPENK